MGVPLLAPSVELLISHPPVQTLKYFKACEENEDGCSGGETFVRNVSTLPTFILSRTGSWQFSLKWYRRAMHSVWKFSFTVKF